MKTPRLGTICIAFYLVTANCLLLAALSAGISAAEPTPHWVWRAGPEDESLAVRRTLLVPAGLRQATLTTIADYCDGEYYVNGERIAETQPYDKVLRVDILAHLRVGENALGVRCRTRGGPAAWMAQIDLVLADGSRQRIVSDSTCACLSLSAAAPRGWPASSDDWEPVKSFGQLQSHRWTPDPAAIEISAHDDYTQWKRALPKQAGDEGSAMETAEGFEVELLREAAPGEDSWVSLVQDPQGRWIVGMEKKGLLRLTLPQGAAGGAAILAERIDEQLAECRGLLFVDGDLYAMANNDRGLYRLRDQDQDGRFEDVEQLLEFRGDVGHGRNQLAQGPDGRLYAIFGDSVFEPEDARTLPPAKSRPTAHEKTRSGFVARFDRDGKNLEVVVRGLRNPYGIDFDPHGELFTYDADAEYDMGSSWYRPTRVNHLIPGGDYGWRRVTRAWPPYFPDRPDTPPPTLDIGKGSPTAVKFGTGSRFPQRYREALFVLDWAYGRILAVHLTPRGSSYLTQAETFVRGSPLNVTDVEFGTDGAMYFVTGGRGTRSGLYRVRYVGTANSEVPQETEQQPSEQQQRRREHARDQRQQRRELESFLGAKPTSEQTSKAWQQLGNPDPWIRSSARAVLETGRDPQLGKSLQKPGLDTDTRLAGLLALTRTTEQPLAAARVVLDQLRPLRFQELRSRQRDEMLYLYAWVYSESGIPPAERRQVVELLRPHFPDRSSIINQRLSLLLSEQPDAAFAGKVMSYLETITEPADRLHYLFVLRDVKDGWSAELRESYFTHLADLESSVGGEGMPTFRRLIRESAVASLPPDQQEAMRERLKSGRPVRPQTPPARTTVVRVWKLEDFTKELAGDWWKDRQPAKGRELFAVAQCLNCHRAGSQGGTSGPDLTAIARRFSPRDILVAILEPSRVISEKYAADIYELHDGRIVTGRVVPGDYRSATLSIASDLLKPEQQTTFNKADVKQRRRSTVSTMPKGLLDVLTREEILDLLAFLVRPSQETR